MNLEFIHSRCKEDGGCQIWQGSTNGSGHPKMHDRTCRRVVWELVKGPLPKGKLVTTSCDDVRCLNPEHLKLTTKSEVSKASNARHSTKLKRAAASARTNRAKLGKITMDTARMIRASDRLGIDLAKELNVSPSLISHVRRGASWVEHSSPWAGLGA